jgi:hypothetical protein
MTRPSHMALAVCSLLGSSLALAACGASNACTAADPHSALTAIRVGTPATWRLPPPALFPGWSPAASAHRIS